MSDDRNQLEKELYRLRLERLGINVRIREVRHSIQQFVRPVKTRTHCAHGHELAQENIFMKLNGDGIRYPACLTCRREQGRRARKKNPEAALEATRRWRARERLKKAAP